MRIIVEMSEAPNNHYLERTNREKIGSLLD